jgi:hypothetical protein
MQDIRLTRIFIFLLFTFFSTQGYSQQSALSIDSIFITMRNLQTIQEDAPPAVSDTAYASMKVELNMVFRISNLSILQAVELKYGKTSGKGDIADYTLIYVRENNKDFLVYRNKKFVIVNNKVNLNQIVPMSLVRQTGYLTLKAKDTNNIYSTVFSKRYN